ncbi:hypothetical protein EDB83DRAFT_2316242 [Lactarius deliciosus]|nr:hypothetical protein EDB83DRAFT_2316242 [Lactarius deliciosus]
MAPPLQYFLYLNNNELMTDIHEEVEDQVWIWANIGTTYVEANNLPKSQTDMEGTTTISLNRRLLQAAVERTHADEAEARGVLTTGAVPRVEDNGPITNIEDAQPQAPGEHWHAAYGEEQYPMEIPLEAGGYSSPIFSQGLYMHDQPKALCQEGDNDLQFYTPQHLSCHEVNKVLVKLADLGVCADVLRHSQVTTHKNEMLGRMRKLERQWAEWAAISCGIDTTRTNRAKYPTTSSAAPRQIDMQDDTIDWAWYTNVDT